MGRYGIWLPRLRGELLFEYSGISCFSRGAVLVSWWPGQLGANTTSLLHTLPHRHFDVPLLRQLIEHNHTESYYTAE